VDCFVDFQYVVVELGASAGNSFRWNLPAETTRRLMTDLRVRTTAEAVNEVMALPTSIDLGFMGRQRRAPKRC